MGRRRLWVFFFIVMRKEIASYEACRAGAAYGGKKIIIMVLMLHAPMLITFVANEAEAAGPID
jgi:hypothetical protein